MSLHCCVLVLEKKELSSQYRIITWHTTLIILRSIPSSESVALESLTSKHQGPQHMPQ